MRFEIIAAGLVFGLSGADGKRTWIINNVVRTAIGDDVISICMVHIIVQNYLYSLGASILPLGSGAIFFSTRTTRNSNFLKSVNTSVQRGTNTSLTMYSEVICSV